jgi:hypothetical protein
LTLEFIATGAGELRFQEASASNGGGVYIDNYSLIELVPEVTNTDIEVVKEGQIRVPRFTSDSSKIDCGNYNDLTGDITYIAWCKRNSNGRSVLQARYLDNGKLIIRATSANDLAVTSDGTTPYSVSIEDVPKREWFLLTITRKADGTVAIYYDGKEINTDTSSTGTPVAGTSNIFVGSEDNGNRGYDGCIAETIVIDGLLTVEEISQYYSSTKHIYNK